MKYLLLTVSVTTFLAAVFMAIIPCVTPRQTYMLHQDDYDFWRVYCHNPNFTPRIQRQNKVFTVGEMAVKCKANNNLGYEEDMKPIKTKKLAASLSTTELITDKITT